MKRISYSTTPLRRCTLSISPPALFLATKTSYHSHLLLFFVLMYQITCACFFPDGTLANHIPCSSNDRLSACCDSDDYCLSNGLCLTSTFNLNRGSCTDSTWKAPECTTLCVSGQYSQIHILCAPEMALTYITTVVATNTVKALVPCSNLATNLWSCTYNGCLLDNFTVPSGDLMFQAK